MNSSVAPVENPHSANTKAKSLIGGPNELVKSNGIPKASIQTKRKLSEDDGYRKEVSVFHGHLSVCMLTFLGIVPIQEEIPPRATTGNRSQKGEEERRRIGQEGEAAEEGEKK